jgi:DNA-binding NtrC family response regulator
MGARKCPVLLTLSELMPTTVYVVDQDLAERGWIEGALAHSVGGIVFLDDPQAAVAQLASDPDGCLIASADGNEAATLRMVRDLRSAGATVPVIVLGPHTAFRTAVSIARLDATDFLERPVSVRQLRAALRRACPEVK